MAPPPTSDTELLCLLRNEEWSRRMEKSDKSMRTLLGLTNFNDSDETAVTRMKKFQMSAWTKRNKLLEEHK